MSGGGGSRLAAWGRERHGRAVDPPRRPRRGAHMLESRLSTTWTAVRSTNREHHGECQSGSGAALFHLDAGPEGRLDGLGEEDRQPSRPKHSGIQLASAFPPPPYDAIQPRLQPRMR